MTTFNSHYYAAIKIKFNNENKDDIAITTIMICVIKVKYCLKKRTFSMMI